MKLLRFTLRFLFVWLVCLIGLSGCNKEENEDNSYYQGYIESVSSQGFSTVSIKVTYSPFNKNELPRNNDLLFIEKDDFPSIIFKEKQKNYFFYTICRTRSYDTRISQLFMVECQN